MNITLSGESVGNSTYAYSNNQSARTSGALIFLCTFGNIVMRKATVFIIVLPEISLISMGTHHMYQILDISMTSPTFDNYSGMNVDTYVKKGRPNYHLRRNILTASLVQ